jgi:hypothetical protein
MFQMFRATPAEARPLLLARLVHLHQHLEGRKNDVVSDMRIGSAAIHREYLRFSYYIRLGTLVTSRVSSRPEPVFVCLLDWSISTTVLGKERCLLKYTFSLQCIAPVIYCKRCLPLSRQGLPRCASPLSAKHQVDWTLSGRTPAARPAVENAVLKYPDLLNYQKTVSQMNLDS